MGHLKKIYMKRKAWFEKKCEHCALVFFELNFTEVPQYQRLILNCGLEESPI